MKAVYLKKEGAEYSRQKEQQMQRFQCGSKAGMFQEGASGPAPEQAKGTEVRGEAGEEWEEGVGAKNGPSSVQGLGFHCKRIWKPSESF